VWSSVEAGSDAGADSGIGAKVMLSCSGVVIDSGLVQCLALQGCRKWYILNGNGHTGFLKK